MGLPLCSSAQLTEHALYCIVHTVWRHQSGEGETAKLKHLPSLTPLSCPVIEFCSKLVSIRCYKAEMMFTPARDLGRVGGGLHRPIEDLRVREP